MLKTLCSLDMAWKTAITRKTLSAPALLLQGEGLLKRPLLDYGCGRGDDAEKLGCEKYDPHFSPSLPKGRFKTILCTYVLNTIEVDEIRRQVLHYISDLLRKGGVAYITVRNDKARLKGLQRRGVWQGRVKLGLPVVHKSSRFVTYKLCKGGSDCSMEVEVHGE